MAGRLDGKVAIITGGTSGIGAASAELFVAEGARVVIAGRNEAAGAALERDHPGVLYFKQTEVSDDTQIEALVDFTVEKFERLDVFFNNAGIRGEAAGFFDIEATRFDEMMRLLLGAYVSGHKYAARQFRKQGTGGSIISTSSAAGIQGGYAPLSYTSAKHAISGLAKAATAELAPHGIRSNVIAPGITLGPIIPASNGVPPEDAAEYLDFVAQHAAVLQPLGRAGWPIDIAYAALFLASDESAWISGVTLPVDGGATSVIGNPPHPVMQRAAAEYRAAHDAKQDA
ncbi:SDR family NAD(P)-dependent oxidoreductase [Microbacterium sp. A93]|uniref:SDR family NAD(P)-dependent oxidoreductase n=1 Tax=Microbacterium sp. A93 TaxID=3450716 RepID=UPI003F440EAC